MDKKIGVLALFLSAMFGACSNDESVINEGGENNGKEVGYIAVNIVQPASASSRAADVPDGTTTGEYMAGDEEENFAEEATFIIYSDDTYKSTQTIHLTSEPGDATSPEREKIYRAVLVIDADDKLKPDSKNPLYAGEIFCVLNAPEAIKNFNGTGSNTKATLKGLIADCGGCTKGSFIMSNSTYRDKNGTEYTSVISGTEFTTANYRPSSSEALKNPVDIYVERVVARVDTKKADNFANTTGADPFNVAGDADVTNDADKLTIRITGIEIANIANKSYVFKNVDGWNGTGSGWPNWGDDNVWDATNRRCYWEIVPSMGKTDYHNKSYNTIAGATVVTAEGTTTQNPGAGGIYASLTDDKYKTRTYIQPNTNSEQKTSVLVTAQLLDKDGKKLTNDNELVWIKGGYFTSKDARALVCQYLKTHEWAVKEIKTTTGEDGQPNTTTTFRDITPEDLVWARYVDPNADSKVLLNSTDNFKDYQAIAQVDESKLPAGSSICKAENVGTDKAAEKFKDETKKISYSINDLNGASVKEDDGRLASQKDLFAEVFKDGLCYYFVEIDQTNVLGPTIPENTTHYEGVVRNHIYDLTLSGIQGIGTAVFDPEATIIPQEPSHDDFYYLAARVNVLKWKVVKQGIVFGE